MTEETLSNRKRAVQIVEACFDNPPMRGKKIAGDFVARYIVAMLIADGLLVTDNDAKAGDDDDAFPVR